LRVDACGQVVEHHLAGVFAQGVNVLFFRARGQHVQVGDDKVALVLVLQAHAVDQAAHVMA